MRFISLSFCAEWNVPPFHCLYILFFFLVELFLFFILKLYLRLFIFIFGLFAATNGNSQFMHLYPERMNWNKIEWSERLSVHSIFTSLNFCCLPTRFTRVLFRRRRTVDERSTVTFHSSLNSFRLPLFEVCFSTTLLSFRLFFFIDVTAKGILFYMIFPFIQFTTCTSFCFYACPSLFSFTPLIFFFSYFSLTCIRWINDFLWFECFNASEDLSSTSLVSHTKLNRGATHLSDFTFYFFPPTLFIQRIQLKCIAQVELIAKVNKYCYFSLCTTTFR